MTMTLTQVRDWLKTLGVADHYYIGKLDRKREKSLGVYSRAATGGEAQVAIGGDDATRTRVKQISLLLHWNNNANETETAAQALYDALRAAASFQMDQLNVSYLRLRVPEPVDVGTDDNGVYERVIWMDLYYERNE